MRTRTLLLLVLLCTGYMACKKASPADSVTKLKIIGKWNFQHVIVNDFFLGASHIITYPSDPGNYFDFRADGKVYSFTWGSYDTSTYTFISDSKLKMDPSGDTSDIILISESALQLYQKTVFAPGEYSESTIYLNK